MPGPACYGRGGTEPTTTDALLALGWLDDEHPLADDVVLNVESAHAALDGLASAAGLDRPRLAAGIVDVATAAMARALKQVSVKRGIDPRGLALMPFGGAGPLFGCLLADELGLQTVILPPHPGVLSALGLAAAPERIDAVQSLHRPVHELHDDELQSVQVHLERTIERELPGSGEPWRRTSSGL